MTQFYHTEDQYQLHVEEYGDVKNQDMVLVHGLGGRCEWFRKQINFFKQDFHVVVYDQRGHGQSEKKNQNLTISQLAKDLDALIRHMDLKDIVLLGWSLGVNVVLSYIQQFGDNRLSRLVLVDNTPNMITSDSWKYGTYPNALAAVKDIAQMCQGWSAYASACIPVFIGEGGTVSQEDRKWFDTVYPDNDTLAMVALFASNLSTDLSGVLPQIHVPTMITYGELPSYGTKELLEGIASYIENAKVVCFGGGHLHFWQDAENFNRQLMEFIR